MTSQKKVIPKIDYGIILTLMLLTIFSLISIYSAQSTGQYIDNFIKKQLMWYVISIIAIIVVIRLDSDQLKKISWYTYGFGLFLLLILFIAPESLALTKKVNGAQSWFFTPIGSIQPSEYMKVFTIISLAKVTADHHQKFILKTVKTDLWLMMKIAAVAFLPVVFIIMQPDLGTSLVFVAIFLGMILVSGITWKLLLPIFTGFTLLGGTVMYFAILRPDLLKYVGVKQYQFARIYSWLDPHSYSSNEGMQLVKSLLAVGSGQTKGKGFANREVYLPESHSDFIFSTIGEEFGFIGGSILISLFFLLIYQITRTGLDTKNPFYTYICVGVISMLAFHVFQNIGMTIQVLPITGIPLPFISYGGSSLLSNMLAMGVVLSIRYHYKKYMFSSEE
ncbi:FtsW/RodA/SpoVE family cell cycle protein [Lederbergia lenta]|uniref:Cell cycle protein n=2 Tax=Lederbergia lenta TaxID=1467 RepID=A0A2X4WSY8_LEDLE|nr:FtsW/RodA/SpoVE family cell cycle protein [Lederbergia lenta]MCM3112986.1 rod shape-determining protein RodA [Lederbergia lenta]MEC2322712.1 FtsW/RodA/SpoVE family cell cycle protein [Lederbergia lenta]SQI61652.1 cell cycle protein [Lederbergia lenta]